MEEDLKIRRLYDNIEPECLTISQQEEFDGYIKDNIIPAMAHSMAFAKLKENNLGDSLNGYVSMLTAKLLNLTIIKKLYTINDLLRLMPSEISIKKEHYYFNISFCNDGFFIKLKNEKDDTAFKTFFGETFIQVLLQAIIWLYTNKKSLILIY